MTDKLQPCPNCGNTPRCDKVCKTAYCDQCKLMSPYECWNRINIAPEPHEGEMVRVRAAVGVYKDRWSVIGWSSADDDDMRMSAAEGVDFEGDPHITWIEATIPKPQVVEAEPVSNPYKLEADDG